MIRLRALWAKSLRAAAATRRTSRAWAAVALVAGSAVAGAACGVRDAGLGLDADGKLRAESDRMIQLVEEVSTLADLDARSEGSWDRYETGFSDAGIAKGVLTRYFPLPGPRVRKKPGEPVFPSTSGLDAGTCHRIIQVLASGPLARRIEVSSDDDWFHGWEPLRKSSGQCGDYGSKKTVGFRVAPRPQDPAARAEARAR